MRTTSDDFWERDRRARAAIPAMGRVEYLRKYPKGGPERFSGRGDSAEYREFIAAVKRRDKEAKRPGRAKFLWAMGVLAVLFGVVSVVVGVSEAVLLVFMLVMAYCCVEMGMNLPSR